MARKKPSNIKASGIPERIARTDAKGKQTQLETRLGRLVLKLPPGYGLHFSVDIHSWFVLNDQDKMVADAVDNPIDALLAAGITDD